MKHLSHLLLWDIRRFRLLLLAWLITVAATAALDAIWPQTATDPDTRRLVGTIGNLLALTEVLLSLVLIAQVVQAHALVGTTAFWMTRPIPAGTLLVAKLTLLAAMMIAAPVLAEVVVMTIYDVPLADIIGVSMQTALLSAAWIAALVAAAAITPNLAKFALAIGSALVATIVSISLLIATTMSRFESEPPQGQLSLGGPPTWTRIRDGTPDVVGTALLVVALLVLLVVQYRSRRRWLSVGTGLAGILAAWLVFSSWPWPFLAPIVTVPAWAANPAALSLTATSDTVALEPIISFGNKTVDWRQARARVRLRGIEPGWTAAVGVRSATVEIPGGTPLVSNYSGETRLNSAKSSARCWGLPLSSTTDRSTAPKTRSCCSRAVAISRVSRRLKAPTTDTFTLDSRNTSLRRCCRQSEAPSIRMDRIVSRLQTCS
jgi:hypothetical protein